MNFNLKVRGIRIMFIKILSHIFAEIALLHNFNHDE
jgi:hypothetical protein